MKKFKVFLAIFLPVLFFSVPTLTAQTYHEDLHTEINNLPIFCLDMNLSGEWTYSISFHVDKKTGCMTRIHWQVKKAFLYDSEGVRYHIVDTGTDSYLGPTDGLGGISYVDLWNNIEGFNMGYIDYINIDDGWLDGYPVELPYEGTVSAMFRINGGGEHLFFREYIHYEVNKQGDLVIDRKLVDYDCNW